MDTRILIFIVLFFSYYCNTTSLKILKHLTYNRLELLKNNPGLGTDFIYFRCTNGTLARINLKGDEETEKKMKKFYKLEKELYEDEQSKQGTFIELLGVDGLSENDDPVSFNFTRDDITFTLYNRKNTTGVNMKDYDISEYDTGIPTKFVTHGFLSSGTADSCILIKDGYLNTSDVNVIIINWSSIAGNVIYPIPAYNTADVADYTTSFLAYLVKHIKVQKEDIHLIGHSLGAHVMGFTGKRLIIRWKIKVNRITGLDPAGPLFANVHLNERDAEFVDIIHTDGGLLGLNDSVGDVDFYPNGGSSPQPGCENTTLLGVDSCSHSASWKIFAQSIVDEDLYIGNCTDDKQFPMGSGTPSDAKGQCDVDTDPARVFSTENSQSNFLDKFTDLWTKIKNFFKKICNFFSW